MLKKHKKLTLTLIVIVGLLTVSPVIMLVFGSFTKGLSAFGAFTLEKYISVVNEYPSRLIIEVEILLG